MHAAVLKRPVSQLWEQTVQGRGGFLTAEMPACRRPQHETQGPMHF
jgi:hypothetical protein